MKTNLIILLTALSLISCEKRIGNPFACNKITNSNGAYITPSVGGVQILKQEGYGYRVKFQYSGTNQNVKLTFISGGEVVDYVWNEWMYFEDVKAFDKQFAKGLRSYEANGIRYGLKMTETIQLTDYATCLSRK